VLSIVKTSPKLNRYTSRPSTAVAASRMNGSLLGPAAAAAADGWACAEGCSALPNCCVGALNCVVGCWLGGYPELLGG
jgi:hypothetical protein